MKFSLNKNSKRLQQVLCRAFKSHQVEATQTRLTPNQIRKVDFIAEKFFELSPGELQYVFNHIEQATKPYSIPVGFIDYDRNLATMLAKGELTREDRGIPERKRRSPNIDEQPSFHRENQFWSRCAY